VHLFSRSSQVRNCKAFSVSTRVSPPALKAPFLPCSGLYYTRGTPPFLSLHFSVCVMTFTLVPVVGLPLPHCLPEEQGAFRSARCCFFVFSSSFPPFLVGRPTPNISNLARLCFGIRRPFPFPPPGVFFSSILSQDDSPLFKPKDPVLLSTFFVLVAEDRLGSCFLPNFFSPGILFKTDIGSSETGCVLASLTFDSQGFFHPPFFSDAWPAFWVGFPEQQHFASPLRFFFLVFSRPQLSPSFANNVALDCDKEFPSPSLSPPLYVGAALRSLKQISPNSLFSAPRVQVQDATPRLFILIPRSRLSSTLCAFFPDEVQAK